MTTRTMNFTDAEQAVVDALVAEGFAFYAPRGNHAMDEHSGFVVSEGPCQEEDQPTFALVNFASDTEGRDALTVAMTHAYAAALKAHGFEADVHEDGDCSVIICWKDPA